MKVEDAMIEVSTYFVTGVFLKPTDKSQNIIVRKRTYLKECWQASK